MSPAFLTLARSLFSKFFAVKEGLALLYETFGLDDEALMQYDELEAVLSSRPSSSALGLAFGGHERGDASGAIFSARRKDYRARLFDATITEFDLRHYLFARQAKLLFARVRPCSSCPCPCLWSLSLMLSVAQGMALVVAERGLRLVDTLNRAFLKHKVTRPCPRPCPLTLCSPVSLSVLARVSARVALRGAR